MFTTCIPVVGGEAVVDGGDDGRDGGGKVAAEVVEVLGVWSVMGESAAVEVYEQGKGLGGGRGRAEEAEPQVAGGVDCDVGGGDACFVHDFGGRCPCFRVYEAEEESVDRAVAPCYQI